MTKTARSSAASRGWRFAVRGSGLTICLLAICCLSFAARVFLLDTQSIWWDEAISIHLATSSARELLANRAAHVHPPLYFLILKGWVELAGVSAFSVRFLSVWFNTVLVPVIYALGRRWLGRRTGLLASILMALSPLYIIYSQEARVYAMLPLVYLALLALGERLARGRSPAPWTYWLLLAAVETVGLYLHYVFLFAVGYVNLLLILGLRRRRHEWLRWLASQAVVVLLCLPWVVAAALRWDAILADIGVGDPFVEPVPLGYFSRLLWSFQWSGLSAAPGYVPLYATALVLAVLLPGALVRLTVAPPTRAATLRLLAHWFVPLIPALLMWQAKPLSHPRYVSVFVVALLLLVGYVLDHLARGRWAEKGLAALLGLAILAATVISLRAYYFDPRFAKDDTRGVAAAIAAQSSAGDLVVVPPEDWSVPYYYDGPARVEMPWPGDAATDWEQLANLTQGREGAYLVDYYRATRDPWGLLPFAFESAGSLSDRWDFKGLYVRLYRLGQPVEPPLPSPTGARFGPLRLTGAWVEQGPPADTAVTVALRWRHEGSPAADLRGCRAGLRLRGPDGWEWSTTDDWLLDEAGLPTDRWSVGQEATTYHVLPLPPGTPPLSYTAALGVYQIDGEIVRSLDLLDAAGNPQGQTLDLGSVSLAPPLGMGTDPYRLANQVPMWEAPLDLGGGVRLAGAALDREVVAPGQPLFVTLRWQATAALSGAAPRQAAVTLEQGGERIAAAIGRVGGRYPSERWTASETVVEHRRLVVPPAAADGPAEVVLQVGERRVTLGEVEITAGEHLFTPPPMAHELNVRFGDVAELLGYDLEEAEVASGDPVVITLYWRALGGARGAEYTVFTHLLGADGHLVAQHDGPPAGGTRPTPGWVIGEIVVDRHAMTFREPYAGPAQIEAGLYDAATLERVPTTDGELFALLPTSLTVVDR